MTVLAGTSQADGARRWTVRGVCWPPGTRCCSWPTLRLLARDFHPTTPAVTTPCTCLRVRYLTGDLNVHDVAVRGRPVDDGDPVLVPGPAEPRVQLRPGVAPAVRLGRGAGGPVPPQRAGGGGRAAALRHPLGHDRRARRVAAEQVGGRGRGRRGRTAECGCGACACRTRRRWAEGKLWLLDSGAGRTAANRSRRRVPGRWCAGCRATCEGCAWSGLYALVGLCQIREKHIFGGLPVQQKHEKLLCGVALVDTRTGARVGFLEFTAGARSCSTSRGWRACGGRCC